MLNPQEFIDTYAQLGAGKTTQTTGKLLWRAILAGFFIGMGGVVTNTATFALTNTSVSKVVSGLLFPFGLFMVVMTGAELFTGNCLITLSVQKKRASLRGMLRNLGLVYLGNLVGGVLLSAAVVYSGQLDMSGGALALHTMRLAATKCGLSFEKGLLMGVLCNILVCAGVMCALCGKSVTERAIGALLPVSFFVICGFEHCVANMYYIPAGLLAIQDTRYMQLAQEAGLMLTDLSLSGFLLNNLLPVTMGNILGGCGFAAILHFAYQTTND